MVKSKAISLIRWVLIIPCAAALFIASDLLISSSDALDGYFEHSYFQTSWSSFFFIVIGAMCAPYYKLVVSIFLSALLTAFLCWGRSYWIGIPFFKHLSTTEIVADIVSSLIGVAIVYTLQREKISN